MHHPLAGNSVSQNLLLTAISHTLTMQLGVNVNTVQNWNEQVFIVDKLMQREDGKLHPIGTEEIQAWVVSEGLTAAREVEVANVRQCFETRLHRPCVVDLSIN